MPSLFRTGQVLKRENNLQEVVLLITSHLSPAFQTSLQSRATETVTLNKFNPLLAMLKSKGNTEMARRGVFEQGCNSVLCCFVHRHLPLLKLPSSTPTHTNSLNSCLFFVKKKNRKIEYFQKRKVNYFISIIAHS